jgi:hypothetical protein
LRNCQRSHGHMDARSQPPRDRCRVTRPASMQIPSGPYRRCCQSHSNDQTAACGITGNADCLGWKSLIQQIPVGCDGVFDGGRERMLGRHTEVDAEHGTVKTLGKGGGQWPMAFDGSADIAAAVKIKDGALRCQLRTLQPFGLHRAGQGGRLMQRVWNCEVIRVAIPACPSALDGESRGRPAPAWRRLSIASSSCWVTLQPRRQKPDREEWRGPASDGRKSAGR